MSMFCADTMLFVKESYHNLFAVIISIIIIIIYYYYFYYNHIYLSTADLC